MAIDDSEAADLSDKLAEYLESLGSDDEGNENRQRVLSNMAFVVDFMTERGNRLGGGGDDNDEVPRPVKKRKSSGGDDNSEDKHTEDALARAATFLRDALSATTHGIPPSELANLVTQDNSMNASHKLRIHGPLEDAALRRALVGFIPPHGVDDPSWADLPRFTMDGVPAGGAMPLLDAYCKRSLTLDNDGSGVNLEQRLCKRGSWLGTDPLGAALWVTVLLKKIEMLRFHRDYEALIAGTGGKKRQTALLDKLFCSWLSPEKKDVDVKSAEGVALRKSFNAYFDRQRRSRLRLRDLYNNLGPAVLVDPFWTVDTCFHHRSKAFKKLLEIVFNELEGNPVDDAHALQIRYDDNRRVLLSLAGHLGGIALEEYVVAFMRDQPSLPGRETEEQLASQMNGA